MKFKKLFAVVATVAMIAASAVPAFAGVFGEDYGTIPWAPTAPVIDAQMDDVYADGLNFPIDHLQPGKLDTGLMAECWVVWHGDYLYAFYEVNDPDVVRPDASRSKNPWEYDSVEFFIDYAGTSVYGDDYGDTNATLGQVLQFRIDASGYPTAYGYNPYTTKSWQAYGYDAGSVGAVKNDMGLYAGDFFESAGNFTSDIYTVEYKLPLTNVGFNDWGEYTIKPGDAFAFSVQINDDYTGRMGESSLYRLSGLDDSAWEAQYWPNVVLGEIPEGADTPAEPDPAPVEPDPAPVEPDPAPVEPDPAPVEPEPSTPDIPDIDVPEDPAPVEPDPAPVEPDPAPVEPDPAPVEPDPAPVTPDPAPVTPNAGTADVTAIFSVLASLSAVAGLAISKRK